MNFRQENKSQFRVAKVDADLKSLGSFVDENALLLGSPESMKDWDDLTYLGRTKVQESPFTKTLSQLKTPFNDYLKGSKAVVTVDNDFVRWRSYGDPEFGHMFLEKVSAQTYMGAGKVEFEFKTTFDGHLPGSIIMPLEEKAIKIRVKSYGRKSGNGFIYSGELISDDIDLYLPDAYIAQGKYYLTAGSAYGEASKDLAEIEIGKGMAYVEYEVPMISGAWTFKITDKAHQRAQTLIMGQATQKDGNTWNFIKSKTKLAGYLEMEAYTQIEWMQELWDFYGSASTTLVDRSSNYKITTSAGALEFLSKGNIYRYHPKVDGIDFLSNKLKAVWYDRVEPSAQSVVFFGGQGFIEWFDGAIREKYGAEAVLGTYDFVLAPAKSFHNDKGTKGYAYTSYQFTQYNIPMWGVITVAPFAIFDNTRVNTKKAPNGIYTNTSYDAVAFNIMGMNPNIRKLVKRDSEFSGYICGYWTPLGAAGANNPMKPTTTERAYSWGYGKAWGLQIDNIEDTVWLKSIYS